MTYNQKVATATYKAVAEQKPLVSQQVKALKPVEFSAYLKQAKRKYNYDV